MLKLTDVMLLKILILSQFFLWAMPDEPQVSIGQAFEVFQGLISVKVNWCYNLLLSSRAVR